MTTFDSGRQPWLRRQGLLRNVVRQHVVTRRLQVHLPAEPASVLDVGAGQGTQAIALAQAGHDVLGVEPDETMRAAFAAAAATQPPDVRARLQVVDGRLGALAEAIGERRFDVVCCHGVLMYLPSSREAVVEPQRPGRPGRHRVAARAQRRRDGDATGAARAVGRRARPDGRRRRRGAALRQRASA
ncbi:hypothetical protein GCM10025868_43100 [Angustibacter aerolatus]|uniref:Methyltransferase type 11 domain-containing protein n=1 Tax=Angustibacter aerolatus TaxID=1162965 RepID=A0ABQ6JP72_9ACTN|nr:class I SAM-dependent methyltransferase [Angustibacter aerolatus]GMA89060.1 hypothetical protein GCM10025868_43100 [Angustibacter aerolatus]